MSLSTDMTDDARAEHHSVGVDVAQGAERDHATASSNGGSLGGIFRIGHWINGVYESARKHTIQALPRVIVNNSSNVIGFIQLASEMAMFKANNSNLLNKPPNWNLFRFLYEPPINIWKSVSSNAKFTWKAKDFVDPKSYQKAFSEITDLKAASISDKKSGHELINRWQARSTFLGLVAMFVSAIFPDSKEDKAEVEKNATMSKNNPIGYVGKRLWQAVYFPDWGKHKREFSGLAIFVSGLCSFLSGFRNVKGTGVEQQYVRNVAHSITGLVTAAAGSQLMLAVDSDQGWSRFGTIMWMRLPFLWKSISNRYRNNDPKAHWYTTAQAGLTVVNSSAALYGGAEKLPDGTIIDHKAIREEARKKVMDDNKHKHRHNNALLEESRGEPTTTITAAREHGLAMPERAAAEPQYS